MSTPVRTLVCALYVDGGWGTWEADMPDVRQLADLLARETRRAAERR